MQLTELHHLVNWIDNNVRVPNLPALYQQVNAILQQNVANRNGQSKQSFEPQKVKLFEMLRDIDPSSLNLSQQRMLDTLGLSEVLGSKAIDNIENILFKNSLDIANAHKEFNALVQKINEGLALTNQIKAPFDKLFTEESDDDTLRRNETLMRVHFQHDSSISNVEEFSKWGEKWKSISYGFTRAVDCSVEDIRITGASKGSVILELVAATPIVAMIGGGIKWTLDAIKTGLEIRHQMVATENLKIDQKSKQQMLKLLESSLNNHRKEQIENITNRLVDEHKLNVNSDRGDNVNQLRKSVKDLYEFIEGGGEIDLSPHEEQQNQNEIKLLTQDIHDAREISQEIKALEYKED